MGCGSRHYGAPYTYDTDEAHLKCCVFLQLGQIPVLIDTLSSLDSSEEPPVGPFLTAAGKPAAGLTSSEFVSAVGRYLQQCSVRPEYIVLDRDPTHGGLVDEALKNMGLTVLRLPPRSHDLSPPDSHFFGVVKNNWRKLKWDRDVRDWDEVKALFRECATSTDVSKHIEDYRLRLQACRRAGGHRFQQELREIKREQGLL